MERIIACLAHLVDDILLCLKTFPKWQIKHVYREGNRAAHVLAKEALKHTNDIYCMVGGVSSCGLCGLYIYIYIYIDTWIILKYN
jgi:hypothetical protein